MEEITEITMPSSNWGIDERTDDAVRRKEVEALATDVFKKSDGDSVML